MGLLSQHIASPTGTLNLTNGIKSKTAAICIGIGINAIKRPMSTPLDIIFRFVERYSLGILYFLINERSFSCLDVFLSVFLIIAIYFIFLIIITAKSLQILNMLKYPYII